MDMPDAKEQTETHWQTGNHLHDRLIVLKSFCVVSYINEHFKDLFGE